MTFNPFADNKSISELTESDLGNLITKQVAEGYFVEYKGQFPENSKVAKSIASFANTYGGWYFIGINDDKTNNIPVSIPGIDLAEILDPIDKLREIIKSRIDPTPVFFSKLVELTDKKVVLVVRIPDEQETPFITNDGRVYRRVADSSEPIPETNRYAMDELYQRGFKAAKEFGEFCSDERTFSQAEDSLGWVNVFIKPLRGDFLINREIVTYQRVEQLLKFSKQPVEINIRSANVTGNMPFDSGHITTNSIILRQTNPGRIAFNSLSIELYLDGKAKLHIPLAGQFNLTQEYKRRLKLKSSEAQTALDLLWESHPENVNYLKFFDIEQVFAALAVTTSFYLKCFEDELKSVDTFKYALKIDKVWRSVAFSDSDDWGLHVKKYGLPVIYRDSVQIPRDIERGLLIDTTEGELWMDLAGMLSLEFGLSQEIIVALITALLTKFQKKNY
jgi:Putative DNA-binding domain